MSESWTTKWGPRRVRHDPPTLAEAIAAAQGLTDDVTAQVEIAADLMGATPAEVKAEMQKLAPDRRATRLVEATSRERGVRTVVVERKASRRVAAKDLMARDVMAKDVVAKNVAGKDHAAKTIAGRIGPRVFNLERR